MINKNLSDFPQIKNMKLTKQNFTIEKFDELKINENGKKNWFIYYRNFIFSHLKRLKVFEKQMFNKLKKCSSVLKRTEKKKKKKVIEQFFENSDDEYENDEEEEDIDEDYTDEDKDNDDENQIVNCVGFNDKDFKFNFELFKNCLSTSIFIDFIPLPCKNKKLSKFGGKYFIKKKL
jgi:hypothetical protein